MTNTTTATTKREMTAVARQARRHGYFAKGTAGMEGYVKCPQCGEEVTGYRRANPVTSRYTTMAVALDVAMLAHLPYCGEE